jgi:hypothetical protein
VFKSLSCRFFFIFLLFTGLVKPSCSQPLNYQKLFGDDWIKAMNYEDENRSWMEPILKKNHISYPLAIAVIFPELVRYSALRDKMEISVLKALYINLGEDYANFSIGHFQMKPSFAEIIRIESSSFMRHRSGIKFKNPKDYDDIKDYRKSIVMDMEDPKIQFNYLVAFFKICDNKFDINTKNESEKLKFLATAYNYGIDKSISQIDSMINKKFFNTKLFKSENYSYAEVSLFRYNQYFSEK